MITIVTIRTASADISHEIDEPGLKALVARFDGRLAGRSAKSLVVAFDADHNARLFEDAAERAGFIVAD
jgi:hypothetical protein